MSQDAPNTKERLDALLEANVSKMKKAELIEFVFLLKSALADRDGVVQFLEREVKNRDMRIQSYGAHVSNQEERVSRLRLVLREMMTFSSQDLLAMRRPALADISENVQLGEPWDGEGQ